MGLEKHYPKPRDLNDVSCKSFIQLIVEFVRDKLMFDRIIIVGHSFGGIIANAITYYYPDLVAGVSFNSVSNVSAHLGFLAYTGSSYGVLSEYYGQDWKWIKRNINDIDFQLNYQKIAKKEVYYLYHL
jgi:pimeloyl-ACP methyl ester carboxylesterase